MKIELKLELAVHDNEVRIEVIVFPETEKENKSLKSLKQMKIKSITFLETFEKKVYIAVSLPDLYQAQIDHYSEFLDELIGKLNEDTFKN